MEYQKVKGIIVGERSYGENSKIVDILTKKYGLIGVMAKGAKKLKSPLRIVSQIFTYADFIISYKENKLSTLISADIIDNLNVIKNDIEKISYLNYISDLTKQIIKDVSSSLVFDNYLATILKINEGYDPMVITNILELKYTDYLGISPKFDGCVVCGKSNVVTLSSDKGGFLCKDHSLGERIVSPKTIKIIKLLKYVDISKISKLDISDIVRNEINNFIEDYYDRYTGIYLKSRDFLKKIVNV